MGTTSSRLRTLDLTYIALSAVLITVCAWISIPTTVPGLLIDLDLTLPMHLEAEAKADGKPLATAFKMTSRKEFFTGKLELDGTDYIFTIAY